MQARVLKFTTSNTTLPLLHAFMDNNLITTKFSAGEILLSQYITTLTWAVLEFRADKPHSIVIATSISLKTTPFSTSKASIHPEISFPIPSIH